MAMPWGEIAAAGGQTANNRMQQIIDVYQFAKSIGDEEQMNAAIKNFRSIPNLDPKALQIAAEQMGVQPDVLSGKQRQDQIGALRQLQEIGSKQGMDTAAIAANNQASMAASRQNQADNQAISNSLARRGLDAGSGAELAMRQNAAQTAYNTRAMEGAQNAASAQMRALAAIQESGRLAGDIASQEERLAADNAERRMAVDRFNTSIRDAANKFNSDARFNATRYNTDLAERKIDPGSGVSKKMNLRGEQTGYARDFGNREQLEGEQLGRMFGGGGGMFGFGGK